MAGAPQDALRVLRQVVIAVVGVEGDVGGGVLVGGGGVRGWRGRGAEGEW